MNYALIESGVVVNVIVWDLSPYPLTDGQTLVLIPEGSGAWIGWTYDGTNFIAPSN
jgi:hypothetical protein